MKRRDRRPRAALLAVRRAPARALCLAVVLPLLGWQASPASASSESPPITASELDAYVARVARAWEPYITPDGQVLDPLNPADSGDNYGVILLADVMLKAAARDDDMTLAETGARLVGKVATLPTVEGPFNLLAITTLLRDGQRGRFPAEVWTQLGGLVAALAARVSPAGETGCLTVPSCYSNWRLVWSAGAATLLSGGNPLANVADITGDLAMVVAHASLPVAPSPLPGARELSDPGAEPPSYHLFSCALLELIAEADPAAITPAVEALREQAARYALLLMAPDGQLSYAGRSLDQSWVQAAGAALGARQAVQDPAHAAQWRSFADRALRYLLSVYPTRPDGVLPIVPGLLTDWSPTIIDSYAALDQYEGLTLWFLSDALEHWPEAPAARAPLPSDASNLLVGDLRSSGLVWGRAGPVWWALSGHSTATDPRSAQGLVAMKVQTASGWHDLLALRPLQPGLSSVWTLRLPNGQTATPIFTTARGSGKRAVLTGSYRLASGHVVASATWTLTTTGDGITLVMTRPRRTSLQTTVWLTAGGPQLSAGVSSAQRGRCMVTASGPACPTTLRWSQGEARLVLSFAPSRQWSRPRTGTQRYRSAGLKRQPLHQRFRRKDMYWTMGQ